jgi:hypothetical protein
LWSDYTIYRNFCIIPPAKNIFHASEFIGAKNRVNIKHFKPYFNKLLEGENFFITYPLKKKEATLMGSEIYLKIRTKEVFDLDKFPPNTYVLVDHPSTTFRLGNVFLMPSMTAVFSMMLYPLRWCVPPLASKFWGLCESNSPNAFALLKLGIAIILGYSFVIELWTAIKKFSFESFMGFACFFIAVCFLFNIIGFTGILGEEVAGSMTMMHILCPAMIFAIFNYFNKNPLLYYVSGPVGMRGENIIEKVEGLKVFLEDKKKSNSSLMNLSTEDKLTIKEMIRKYHEKKTKVEEEEIVAEISKLDGSRDYLNKKQYDRLIDFSKDMRHNTSIPGLQANDYSASLLLKKIWENRTNGDPNASNRQDLFNRQPTALSAIHLSDPITQSKNRETATVKRIISDLNNEELSILHNGNNESLQEWGRQTELLHSLLRKENFVTLVEIQNLKAYFDSMLDYIARNNHATRELTEKSLGIVKDYLEAIEAKKPQMVSTSYPVFFKATKQDFRQTINAETEGLWVSDEEAKQFCRENRIEGFRAIARDGNCFFHTVLAALPKEHPLNQHPEGYQQLRQQAVQYMRNNPERFPPSCIEGESLDAYLNRMAQPAQWAEGAIIDATALLLSITINVIQLEKENDEIKTSGHFTAGEVGNAEGAIVVVRVNQNHYHLGVPLQPDLQPKIQLKR